VRTTLCGTSPDAPRDAQLGALSFIHRFGSALNAHFHFHLAVLDGVCSRSADGEVRFHEAARLQSEDWHQLQHIVQRRVLRYFRTRGLLDELDTQGMLSWRGSGGFSIDASVRVEGEDRPGVEPLLRYCARPPFALERLYAPGGIVSLSSPESTLVYRLPKPAPDGRTELLLSPLQLLERLARFIPPPRVHRHRYHGVLAPNAKLRAAVTCIGRPEAETRSAPLAARPRATSSSIRLRPSSPPRPNQSLCSYSTSRCPSSSTNEDVCPRLSVQTS